MHGKRIHFFDEELYMRYINTTYFSSRIISLSLDNVTNEESDFGVSGLPGEWDYKLKKLLDIKEGASYRKLYNRAKKISRLLEDFYCCTLASKRVVLKVPVVFEIILEWHLKSLDVKVGQYNVNTLGLKKIIWP